MMTKRLSTAIISIIVLTSVTSYAENFIVYTAHQEWLSRIYILRMDGSVYNYYEYSMYRLVDLQVVNNEVYVAEAFAPRVYKVDLYTGNLDVIIDDWSLFYFYGLAFDGTYFYVDEWDLNRYDINGYKDGTASFDEYVLGAAWDGSYYWTLNDIDQIRCWDISNWPTITEVPANAFTPPDSNCRGLWFDGQYFWTAQSIDGALGYIYQFDYNGTVTNQWLEPAFMGWSACVVDFAGKKEQSAFLPVKNKFRLEPSFPNPFQSQITLNYFLLNPGQIRLTIHNVLGQHVITLTHAFCQAGKHTAVWSGQDASGNHVPPGAYIVRLECNKKVQTQKIIFLK